MLICPTHGLYEGECAGCKKSTRTLTNKRKQLMQMRYAVRVEADVTGICPECKRKYDVMYPWRVAEDRTYKCIACDQSKVDWSQIPIDDMCPKHNGPVLNVKDWVLLEGQEPICRKCHQGYCWRHMHKAPCIACDTEKKVQAMKKCIVGPTALWPDTVQCTNPGAHWLFGDRYCDEHHKIYLDLHKRMNS